MAGATVTRALAIRIGSLFGHQGWSGRKGESAPEVETCELGGCGDKTARLGRLVNYLINKECFDRTGGLPAGRAALPSRKLRGCGFYALEANKRAAVKIAIFGLWAVGHL
jgi:hypothetical protein